MGEVECSTHQKHVKFATQMRRIDVEFRKFCRIWELDSVSRGMLEKVGMWEAKDVFESFKPNVRDGAGRNRCLQSLFFLQKPLQRS